MRVEVKNHQVTVGETGIPLLGGEVHYWRLAPEVWRACLTRVRELGLQVVASYICWDFHEFAPGRFDFTGRTDPRRNLVGFLNLLTEMGTWIIIRPGPYVYTEWSNGGVPDAAARYHRLHPEFLRLAERYMAAVTPVIAPYFATRGGRIILLQADNELDPWQQWHTTELGLGTIPGPFQAFLARRYGEIGQLNAAWHSAYPSFDAARAVMALPAGREDLLPRYLDYCRFRHDYVLTAARWAVETYRRLGVDVPIYLNTYGGVSIQPWAEMEQIAEIVGPDLYPTNEFTHRTEEHRHFLESVRYTRAYSRLSYSPEFESGIWHGWHYENRPLTGNHYRLMGLSALLAGIHGWSWYMLVNRDNWYMCPINEWGRVRPELYEPFRQVVKVYQAMAPAEAEKLTVSAVTFDVLQQAAQQPGQEMLRAFYQAGLEYEFFDPACTPWTKPLMFYAGGAWLGAAAQDRLLRYVEEGGHLVLLGSYPRLDDQGQPLNRLGIPEPAGLLGHGEALRFDLNLAGQPVSVRSFTAAWFHAPPGEPIVATRRRGEILHQEELALIVDLVDGAQYTLGFTRQVGRGRLTFIGLEPSPELILALHEFAGVTAPARALTPDACAALFRRGDAFFLVVTNAGNEDKGVEIALDVSLFAANRYQLEDLVRGDTTCADRSQLARLHVSLPRKDATVLKMVPTH